MLKFINSEQRKALSSFFINIAAGWFIGLFSVQIFSGITLWIFLRFLVNIIIALFCALYVLKEEL